MGSVPFDARVPGMDGLAEAVTAVAAPDETGGRAHVLVHWPRVPRQAMLTHLYDVLERHGIDARPARAEALTAWRDMHPTPPPAEPTTSTAVTASTAAAAAVRMDVDGGAPVQVTEGFAPLLVRQDKGMYINHVWVTCTALGFPLEDFEKHHASLAADVWDRFTRPSAATDEPRMPVPFVKAYRYRDTVAPLLVWYCIHEQAVVCIFQEYLHLRYGHIPRVCCWYWQLLPDTANLNVVGEQFHEAGILPSLRWLVQYATEGIPYRMACEAARSMHGRNVDQEALGPGAHAYWLGGDVFFFVRAETKDQATANNCRAPDAHGELPRWVMPMLRELTEGKLDGFNLQRNVDICLAHFQTMHGGAAQRLLRSVNWSGLPLVWRPMFVRDIRHTTTRAQAEGAHEKLIKNVAAMWEDAPVVAEAIEILGRLTTACQ